MPGRSSKLVRGGKAIATKGVTRRVADPGREEQLLRLEHAVSRIFAETADTSEALRAAMRAICESEQWACGRYLCVDGEAGVLRFGEAWCIADPAIERYIDESRAMTYPPGTGLVGKVWQSQQPLWITDITKDARVARPALARSHGLKAAVVVPVASEGRTSGVLILHCREDRRPEERLLQTLRVVGGQMAQLAQRALAEEGMRRFRLAMDFSPDMVALVDRATMRYIDVNDTMCRLLGYSRDELLALGPADLVAVPREVLERDYDALIANPSASSNAKSTYRCKDGSLLPFESSRQLYRSGGRSLIVSISRDIRERLAAEAALRDSEERFRSLIQFSSDWYWEQDADLRFVATAGASDARGGITAAAHLGKRRWELPRTEIVGQSWEEHMAVCAARKPFRDLLLSRTDDNNEKRYVSVDGTPIFDAAGVFKGYRGVSREVTGRVRGEQLLRLEHKISRDLSEAQDGAAGIRAVLQAVCGSEDWDCGRYFALDEEAGLLRFQDGFARHEAFRTFIEDSRALTFRPGQGLAGMVLQDGKPVWSNDTSSDPRVMAKKLSSALGIQGAFAFAVVSQGAPIGVLSFSTRQLRPPDERLLQATGVIGANVGQFLQRKRAEDALAALAYTDVLTGLSNRTSLSPAFEQAVERARRRNARIATMFVDLDGFKEINDEHGHEAGDRLLAEIGRRLRATLRASDLIARLGGDEFFVVLEDQQDTEAVETVARKLLAELYKPFEVAPGKQVQVSSSIGLSVFPNDAQDAATLMKHSDAAMYQAKQAGKNSFRHFGAAAPAYERVPGS